MDATVDGMNVETPGFYRFRYPLPQASFPADPVGALEVAERLGVKSRSIHMMHRRGVLPERDYESVNGSGAWEWRTILWWAGETNRLRAQQLIQAYLENFGVEHLDRVQGRTHEGVSKLPTPA